jgi:hypothetical protein
VRRAAARTVAGGALLLGAALASTATASGAGAPDKPLAAQTGATPPFASLPEGHLPPLPRATPPRHIAAREKVAGFVGAGMAPSQAQQMRMARQNITFSYLFPGEEQAKAYSRTPAPQTDSGDTCLIEGGDAQTLEAGAPGDGTEAEPREWPANFTAMLSFQFQTSPVPTGAAIDSKRRPPSGGDVHAVRSERFVAGPEAGASLEIADAWYDVRTHGARPIDHATLPLARVLVGPNGLEVYAARDGDAVVVVVHTPEHAADDAALADQLRTRMRSMTFTLPDHSNGSTDCGHFRVSLRAAAGAGQMVTLQTTAFLPALDGAAGEVPDGESDEGRGARLLGLMRQRPFQLSVSATTARADRTPVVSIALGWSGREGRSG